ncbi:hypothetical protein LH23_17525 [Cedecea neteri]|uniref:Uncharacterized protein n=1 Tax=Cedecea neteri TaxID=158822 RepID=A0AAN0S6Z0_9ENTR|nr:hypothetical protein LH23_17525 [Cedecea neteri]
MYVSHLNEIYPAVNFQTSHYQGINPISCNAPKIRAIDMQASKGLGIVFHLYMRRYWLNYSLFCMAFTKCLLAQKA